MKAFLLIADALVWRHLKQDVVRALITLLGVALGVSVAVAIRLANTSVLGAFRDSVDRIAGTANLQIRGDGFPFDESLLEEIDWVFPVAEISPVVSGTIILRDYPGEVIEVLGVDLLRDHRTRQYRLIQAGREAGEGLVKHLLHVTTARDGILLTEALAGRLGIGTGTEIEVLADDRSAKLKVLDLLGNEGLGSAMSGSIALMDIAAAQWLFQKTGKLDRIDLVVRNPEEVVSVQSRLRGQVPGFLLVDPPERRTQQVEKMISAYQLNLTAMSWIALFVGAFLIHNTVSIAVLRRRREIGISRALGVSRRSIALAFGMEALILGVVGSGLGILLGWALAAGSIGAAAGTAAAFYERVVVTRPSMDSVTVLLAFAAGLGLSVFSGLLPVREAMRVPPAEATRTGSRESRLRGAVAPCALAGLAVLGMAWAAGLQPPVGRKPVFGFVSSFLIIVGFSLLSPAAILAFQFLLKAPMAALLKSPGRIAAAGLSSSLGRTSVTVAALMIGLAMTVGMGIMIHSFRRTIDVWVSQTVKSDLWIKAASSHRIEGRISRETIDKIAAVKGVQEIDPYREIHTTYQGTPVILGAGLTDVAARYSQLPIKEGGSTEEVMRKGLQGGWCIVSESFSMYHGVGVNDEIRVRTPKGQLPLRVAGVYYEYSNDRGYIIIALQTFVEEFGDESANVVSVYVEPGEDLLAVRDRILAEVGREHPLVVRTMATLKAEIFRIFDRTFAITSALQLIAIVVAVLGTVNTQIALVLERRREIAVLRYLGASVKQIKQTVILESGLLGLVGIVLGVAAGAALAAVLIFVINKQSFGWTIQTYLPVGYVALTALLVLVSTVLAGIYPAALAARVSASEALRAE